MKQHANNRCAQGLILFLTICYSLITQAQAPSYLQTLNAWHKGCAQLSNHNHSQKPTRDDWKHVCLAWKSATPRTENDAKLFFNYYFEQQHTRQQVLFTGYYTPLFHACWERSRRCSAAIYSLPTKKYKHLSRAAINKGKLKQHARILAWMDPVDRYFLQIQGSGEVYFNSGERLWLGYAGKNGQHYRSIGKYLWKKRHISRKELNLKGIRNFLRKHKRQSRSLMEKNPSFVYFYWQKHGGAIGKLGAALTGEHSAAVDTQQIPLGAILKANLTDPFQSRPWQLLMSAQDTGSAIRGNHVDVYMGQGKQAEHWAGYMHQRGSLAVYLPKNTDYFNSLPKSVNMELMSKAKKHKHKSRP